MIGFDRYSDQNKLQLSGAAYELLKWIHISAHKGK